VPQIDADALGGCGAQLFTFSTEDHSRFSKFSEGGMLSAGADPLEGSIVPDARTKGPPAAPGVAVKAEDVPKLEETVGNHVLVLVSRPPPGPRICPNFTSHRRNGRRKVFDVRAGRRASLQQGLGDCYQECGWRSAGGAPRAGAPRLLPLPVAWSSPAQRGAPRPRAAPADVSTRSLLPPRAPPAQGWRGPRPKTGPGRWR